VLQQGKIATTINIYKKVENEMTEKNCPVNKLENITGVLITQIPIFCKIQLNTFKG